MTEQQIHVALEALVEEWRAVHSLEEATVVDIWEGFQIYDLGEMLIAIDFEMGNDDPWVYQDGHWSQPEELVRGKL